MTQILPDTGTIEHLDFTPEIACEWAKPHQIISSREPATLVVAMWHDCGLNWRRLVCRPCWVHLGQSRWRCDTCHARALERDEYMRIVQVIR